MCRVIAVSNQKGGVGKTVSCVNLGIGLAQSGKKVLLIDADPQGSMTISLGYPEPDDIHYRCHCDFCSINVVTTLFERIPDYIWHLCMRGYFTSGSGLYWI